MTSIMPTMIWNDITSNFSEMSPGNMNTVPSPSAYSTSSADSQESSISMASPMTMQLSPQVIFLQDPIAIQDEMIGMPYLMMKEEPVEKFRFRYKSEMMGTHGSILGRNSDKNRKKSYPSVELCNYHGPAIIRCSLYTAHPSETMRTPHTHRLVVRMDNDDKDDPHEIRVSREAGYVAVFQGMGIIHTAKKHIADELVKKKRARFLEVQKLKNINACTLSTKDEAQIRHDAEQEAKRMNLNSVTLCFEAFRQDANGLLYSLCQPIFSKPINNMKSALTGELKICRIDKHVSSCLGGEEVFILVEKVGKKNIKIRFFEVDDEDNTIWEDFGKFSELDVHHQYAIVFRTPPYRDLEIENQVPVFLQLYRPTDGDSSEPIKFTYRPSDKIGRSRKRQRSSLEQNIPVVIETNPKNFVNGNTYNGTSNACDRLINAHNDPFVPSTDEMLEILNPGDENLNSEEFKEFLQNLSLSEFNWLPPPRSRLATTTENGKPDLSKIPTVIKSETMDNKPNLPHFRTDIFKTPLYNIGSDNVACKLPSLPNFGSEIFGIKLPPFPNFGTENPIGKMPPFNMGMEIRPTINCMDYTMTFQDTTMKEEHRMNPDYGATLEADLERDLVTDGPREKPDKRTTVSPAPSRKIPVNTSSSKKGDEIGMYDAALLNIKQEIDKPVQVCASDLLAKRTVEQLSDLLKQKPPAHEMRDRVARVFADCKSETGNGPLHTAILNDQKDLLKQMLTILSRVKDPQTINHRNFKASTPLHMAVRCDQPDSVKALLAVGADPNAVNSVGDTPLHIAAEASHNECLNELLNKDNYIVSNFKPQCDLRNYKGWTPLHLAALQSNLLTVKKLVASGADVNVVDSTCGRTVLHIAVEEISKEIVEYLVRETPVDVNLANYAGNTALHIACVVGGDGCAAIAKLLVESKADPHKPNFIARRKSIEELGTVPIEGIALKQEPESDDDSDDEDRLRINDDFDDDLEGDKVLQGQTSFDLAINNKEIMELLKKVEEQTNRRSKTPELEVEVKEECGSPVSECIVSENNLFDKETLKKLCERLDSSKGWVNLADLLDYSFLVPSIRETKSPSRLLLNYADLHGSVTVDDIRNFLEALDEYQAVQIIDMMLARRLERNSS